MGLVNLDFFKKVSLNNSSFSQEIIERFLQQSEEYRVKLEHSIANSDFKGVKSVMQQLKSQAKVFGADELVAKIRRIEKAHSEKYEQYEAHIKDTKAEFESLVQEVADMKYE